MMEEQLRGLVKGVVPTGTYVSWGIAPKETKYPLIQIHLQSETKRYFLDGSSPFCKAIIQLDVFATDWNSAKSIRSQVETLKDYRGEGVIKNILINTVDYANEQDEGITLYRYVFDLIVFYQEL